MKEERGAVPIASTARRLLATGRCLVRSQWWDTAVAIQQQQCGDCVTAVCMKQESS